MVASINDPSGGTERSVSSVPSSGSSASQLVDASHRRADLSAENPSMPLPFFMPLHVIFTRFMRCS
jgi:hypothetical protein